MAKVGNLDRFFAHTLRQHRTIALQVSQAEIAKRAKYDNVQMVSYIETARHPVPRDMRNRERLAHAYQLDIAEFCKWCLLSEMERDGMPADLLLHLASQPLLGPNDEGPHPQNPGGDRDPGRPGSLRADRGRPSITFADTDDPPGRSTIYRMPDPRLIRDILTALAAHIVPADDRPADGHDQPVRSRSSAACQAARLVLIRGIAAMKQTFVDGFRPAETRACRV